MEINLTFTKEIEFNIITLDELWNNLPQEARNPYGITNEKLYYRLAAAYGRELGMMIEYAKECEKPRITLTNWRQAGTQFIAEFAVSDMTIPSQNKFNFHGQNVSRWRYAGAILYQNGEISTHH